MGALDQVFATAILEAARDATGAAVRLVTGPLKCRAMTANGTSTSLGTELGTSAGYTVGGFTITFGASAAGVDDSNASFTIVNMPACIVVGIEIWDSAGTPARKWWGPLPTPVTCALGDTFTIPSGSFALVLP